MAAKSVRLSGEQLEQIARALAEPRRVQILKLIGASEEPCPCSGILESLDITAPTLSHHIKELEAAGLIETRREGRGLKLTVRRDVMQAYAEHLSSI